VKGEPSFNGTASVAETDNVKQGECAPLRASILSEVVERAIEKKTG